MEVLDVLDELGGVARRTTFGRSVVACRHLERSLAAGEIIDVGGGWLARPGAPPAFVAARRHGATVTCDSAAPFYGLPTLMPGRAIHLAVPRSRGSSRRRPGAMVVLHRESVWTPAPAVGPPLAPLGEVLSRALRCLESRQAIVMVDAALQRALITGNEIERGLTGRGSVAARMALRRTDGGSRSVIETLARLTLNAAGYRVRAGVRIPRVGEVDLLVEERVVIECDGYEYHSGRREYREDRRRDRELVAQGYVVLRFTYEDIMSNPATIIAAVERALAATTR